MHWAVWLADNLKHWNEISNPRKQLIYRTDK